MPSVARMQPNEAAAVAQPGGRTILFVASEKVEFAGLLRHLSAPVRLQWPIEYSSSADLNGQRVFLVANGPGPALSGEAIDVARSRERIDMLVSVGACGGLDPSLRAGEVFVATRIVTVGEMDEFAARVPATDRGYSSGVLLSGDRVIQSSSEKRKLRSTGARVVEMEAAAVARRSRDWNLPFYCIRAVTDMASESFCCDLNGARGADGRFRRWKIVASALRRPARGLPELWRLQRRNRGAALSLGDFLADCRF